ncbi:MAG TPA: hypothetical protein VKB46_04515 [Pyrinomonadaceae bacterium]|nr:hypothetical protein [Pyrinomonadaceae bacterium]
MIRTREIRSASEILLIFAAAMFGCGFFVQIPKEVFWPYLAGIVALLLGFVAMRNNFVQARSSDKLIALGPLLFAAPLTAFAAEHFVFTQFMVPMIPSWIPGPSFWIYFTGVALLATTASIFLNRKVRLSATLLGIMIFSFVVLIHIPRVIANPHDRVAWAVVVRDSCFASAALVLAATHSAGWRTRRTHTLTIIAGLLVGIVLVFFSIEHFLHPEFAPGVPLNKVTPTYIPLRSLWGYVTGVALALGGLCLIFRWRARLAVTSLGFVYLALVIFFYLPVMVMMWARSESRIEGFNYFFDTLMFGGVVLILAGALDKEPTAVAGEAAVNSSSEAMRA